MECAKLLHIARMKGFKVHEIPQKYRPAGLPEAHTAQKRLAELIGGKRIGIKIANTNATSQEFLKLYHPFTGPLLESDRVGLVGVPGAPAQLSISKLNLRLCEVEFAFQVDENLKPYRVAPCVEIVHSSFMDWTTVGVPSLIADLACNGAWIRGNPVPLEGTVLDEMGECVLRVNGVEHSRGKLSNILGEGNKVPSIQNDWELQPGDWISTGVCTDPPYHFCEVGDVIEADFSGGIGGVAFKCVE